MEVVNLIKIYYKQLCKCYNVSPCTTKNKIIFGDFCIFSTVDIKETVSKDLAQFNNKGYN
jgi:hypothetical protein